MRPDERDPRPLLTTPVGTPGDLAVAAFVIAAASGVVVAVPYEPADAYGSLAALLLSNASGSYFRNLHYWSGQACFVLTLLHTWDHLRVRGERRVRPGVWARLALAVPVVAFLMLSGFLLRGDADARQALLILTEATHQIPLAGPLLATLVFGAAERIDLVYIQHAATSTVFVWLVIVEHARRVWPRTAAFLAVLAGTGGLALVASPGLHDGLDPIVKGPWYFLGLQEVLHWTPWPLAAVLGVAALVGLLAAIRFSPGHLATRIKVLLTVVTCTYAALCLVGGFFRGDAWSWHPGWPAGSGNISLGWVFAGRPEVPQNTHGPLPVAMGRPEGCLVCHRGVSGLGKAHSPEAVGCASCHGGNTLTLDKRRAHTGMDVIPGNLATAARRCGQPACHPTIIPRAERSVMATMRGVVAVDRAVFGESRATDTSTADSVTDIAHSPADTHLRQLCASCHLGHSKLSLGPNEEDTHGGGCLACHLRYDAAALAELTGYERQKAAGRPAAPRLHAAVSLDIDNTSCFGCHSRSGRISTNYEGWHEVHEPPADASAADRPAPSRTRVLADNRVFERVMPDIHQQRGLDCIDCHTATEVMGDGVAHTYKRDQLRITCEDCHARPGDRPVTLPPSGLDPESARIQALRQWPVPAPGRIVRSASGEALVNVVTDDTGVARLTRKRTGERRPLKAAAAVCVEGRGHARLSCSSCHTAWAPRCPTCHTSFDARAAAYDWIDDADVKGAWIERSGPFAAAPPTLGVRRVVARGQEREVVDVFVPGMVATIEPPRSASGTATPLFRRLYARIEPHTTRRDARSCQSCHNNPEALGFGQGVLTFERTGRTGRWRFTSAGPAAPVDGLPADAWIPFLRPVTGMVSTRPDVRPFTVEEQRRILTVGTCLTCHASDSAVMRASVRDFAALVARRTPRCAISAFD
jgi:hypothetical protein